MRWLVIVFIGLTGVADAADLVTLSAQTWDRYAPGGKEADAIYGDFALANDRIVVVIGNPIRGRHANMTVREVGGAIVDLTTRAQSNDQLSAYYPGAQTRAWRFGGIDVDAPREYEASDLSRVFVRGKRVSLRLIATPQARRPDMTVTYTLEDGWPYVQVTTTYANHGRAAVDADVADSARVDGTFERVADGPTDLFWAYDKHFGQAYGVAAEGHAMVVEGARAVVLRFRDEAGKVAITLEPGESRQLVRRVFPGANLFDLEQVRGSLGPNAANPVKLRIEDAAGKPVAGAEVTRVVDGKPSAWGRTDARGRIDVVRGSGGSLRITALGHETLESPMPEAEGGDAEQVVRVSAAGSVLAVIVDEMGLPAPCKVQFVGKNGTPSPNFGPDSGEVGVRNVYYSHDGKFQQKLDPGTYDVIVSRGPEHDALFSELEVERGKESALFGRLVRSVKTEGWISADFHSHSSPSGDNTSSQFGRVLNLLCEHIEFAPCTEHNRLTSYDEHLARLRAERLMATCVGMELTGTPLPLNHQNAFPLVMQPHTQDGGGPTADLDPETQIERLALWDGGSEKLVQVNHPDMGWMFFDRNGDGVVDKGFSGMLGRMDVVEVHPPHFIFEEPTLKSGEKTYNNTMHNWMQLLNLGKRVPGVVNTDAHGNFHGSGWLRNYVKSPTDDPSEIRVLDVVHAAEAGHVVMSNGPFMEVVADAGDRKLALPGDMVAGSRVTVRVRVQCPNWFDIDRVAVFANGKLLDRAHFTRAKNPDMFTNDTVKFEQAIALEFKEDTHLIVAAIGEASALGAVMGPNHQGDLPVAVSNPIYLDVDGGGFKPNGDELGGLPVKGGR